ncbi:MAG: translation initiation factor IF-2 [Planctomycetes bacterium]|nr:translation initiation factor IF-2 [Planctomycetota bacterium]
MSEKMRVHILAKELNVPSKIIVQKCQAEGIDSVKNHMSTLSAGLHATICEWFSEGTLDTALETAKPVDLEKVRIKKRRTAKVTTTAVAEAPADGVLVAEAEAVETPALDAEGMPGAAGAALAPPSPAAAESTESDGAVPVEERAVPLPERAGPDAKLVEAVEPLPAPGADTTAGEAIPHATMEEEEGPPAPEIPSPEGARLVAEAPDAEPPMPATPAGPQHVPTPAKLQGPRVVRYEAPDYDTRPPRRAASPSRRDEAPGVPAIVPAQTDAAGAGKATDKGPGRRRSRINPRRAAGKLQEAGERMAEWRDQDLQERKERLAGATGRRIMRRRSATTTPSGAYPAAAGSKQVVTVHEPVRMKEFCSATGLSFVQLFKVLRDEHDLIANINMILPTETAELLALSMGVDLEVVSAKTLLDDVQEEFARRKRGHERPRPPVVAMLGHVDHGKTSLLDAIRKTRVTSTEDGGITQHISSYHLETEHGAVTFLDTPGHEAFAAMRARGAQITDVVVLVIAADDGVMPQTVEAIRHAQASGVAIVVALNKIDLGDQNKLKIYGQLTKHDLTPSGEWGGEIDVIRTSATTGEGVKELVAHLAALSGLLELKADPELPAMGTVIEAETKPGVGAVARVLIQDGTLRVGDFVVVGNAAGKVRALSDDRGVRVESASPSIPIELWGLDDVPLSGDRLYQVETLQRAKDIAAEIKQSRVVGSRQQTRKAKTLQEMLQRRDADEVPELNVIIKGDVDGSVAALRQTLSTIPSDEVNLTIRHAGVGPVNDSDVLLAATSKAVVVAFRVDVPAGARRLGDEHEVDIRSYRVIYDVRDEIKLALEGLLAPMESIERRATVEVREVFHLSKRAGVIAGSHVTDGTMDRSHLVKVVRDGVIVREGVKIASLRRFKDDVKEARSGMDCGIRLEGFDDLHVGDVLEAYVIVKTARTLE